MHFVLDDGSALAVLDGGVEFTNNGLAFFTGEAGPTVIYSEDIQGFFDADYECLMVRREDGLHLLEPRYFDTTEL